jgi:hypothetical protein
MYFVGNVWSRVRKTIKVVFYMLYRYNQNGGTIIFNCCKNAVCISTNTLLYAVYIHKYFIFNYVWKFNPTVLELEFS